MIDPTCCPPPSGGGFLAVGVLLAITSVLTIGGTQYWFEHGHAPASRLVRGDMVLAAVLAVIAVGWSIAHFVRTL